MITQSIKTTRCVFNHDTGIKDIPVRLIESQLTRRKLIAKACAYHKEEHSMSENKTNQPYLQLGACWGLFATFAGQLARRFDEHHLLIHPRGAQKTLLIELEVVQVFKMQLVPSGIYQKKNNKKETIGLAVIQYFWNSAIRLIPGKTWQRKIKLETPQVKDLCSEVASAPIQRGAGVSLTWIAAPIESCSGGFVLVSH